MRAASTAPQLPTRGWSDPEESSVVALWCCVGSALERHSKHGGSLFFEGGGGGGTGALPTNTLYLALYEFGACPTAAAVAARW